MNDIFRKPFSEEFARVCLEVCFPELGWNLELNENDPPDLIDLGNSIGVEVTQAIIEIDAELNSLYRTYKGKKKSEIPKGVLKKVNSDYNKFLFKPDDENGILWACLHRARVLDYSSEKKSIIKKAEKLNKEYYLDCDTNALFIHDEEAFIFEKDISGLIDPLSFLEEKKDKIFDYIIVYCAHEIFFFDVKKETMIKKEINDDTIENMKRMALTNLGRI